MKETFINKIVSLISTSLRFPEDYQEAKELCQTKGITIDAILVSTFGELFTSLKLKQSPVDNLRELLRMEDMELSNKKLYIVPHGLKYALKHGIFQSIDLSNNYITSLPNWLYESEKIISLRLYKNRLVSFGLNKKCLINLRYLNLHHNKNISFPDNLHLPSLQDVRLSSCNLMSFPQFLYKDTPEYIEIKNNKGNLTTIDYDSSLLKKARSIDYGTKGIKNHSIIKNLFHTLEKDSWDKAIKLSRKVLFSDWSYLRKRYENVYDKIDTKGQNFKEDLRKGLLELKELKFKPEKYYVNTVYEYGRPQDNYETKTIVPKGLQDLKNLVKLYIQFKTIYKIPSGLNKLKKMVSLTMDGCNEEMLSKNIRLPKSLNTLNVYGGFSEIGADIIGGDNLKIFKIWSRNLTTIPQCVSRFKNLCELNISGSKLENIPQSLTKVPSIKVLKIKSNTSLDLTFDWGRLSNLRELYIECKSIDVLPQSLSKLKNLRVLSLNLENGLYGKPLKINFNSPMENLLTVIIRGASLNTIPEFISNSHTIMALDVRHNNIENINSLSKLKNIIDVDISLNEIKNINSLMNLKHLKFVNCIGNQGLSEKIEPENNCFPSYYTSNNFFKCNRYILPRIKKEITDKFNEEVEFSPYDCNFNNTKRKITIFK